MTWTDQHQRTEIVHTVLARAALDPRDPGLFTDLPGLDRLFGGVDGLLAALAARWKTHLEAKIEQAEFEGRIGVEAYLELAAEQPALRTILDTYRPADRTLRTHVLAR